MISEIIKFSDKIAKLATVITYKIPWITIDFRASVSCRAIRLLQRATTRRSQDFIYFVSFFPWHRCLRIYSDIRRGLSYRESLNSRYADDESSIPAEVKGGGRDDGILAGSLRFAGQQSSYLSLISGDLPQRHAGGW